MRIIKFRAWDKAAKVWRTITSLDWYRPDTSKTGLSGVIVVLEDGRDQFLPIEAVELVEFTNLLDKNGKEIWEGDIVRHDESGEWEVRFRFGAWHLFGKYPGLLYPEAKGFDHGGKHPNLEVIGNIHQNPDLLS